MHIPPAAERRWTYNGLDCCVTWEVARALAPKLDADATATRVYRAEKAIQAAFLAVQLRGIRLDQRERKIKLKELRADVRRCIEEAERLAGVKLSGEKAISTAKLRDWLYEELRMRPQRGKSGGLGTDEKVLRRFEKRAVAVDDPAADRKEIRRRKDVAAEVCRLVRESREHGKLLAALGARARSDRMRGSINVGATETFRASSSSTPLGDGTNLQNQTKRLRSMYIPDPGYTMAQGDQERAESRAVAYLSGDEGYIRAHEEGNTHLIVARMLWPEAGWSGDDEADLALAKEPNFIRHWSRYDVSKRIQHGSNYVGSPHGLARETGLPVQAVQEAQERYFAAFPRIRKWHETIREQLASTGCIDLLGYRRQFFANPHDPSTLKEAVAHLPQSLIAWTNHIVFVRLWRELDSTDFQLLMHTHDGVLLQFRGEWSEWEPRVLAMCRVEWHINGRVMVIPWEWKVGSNWKEVS